MNIPLTTCVICGSSNCEHLQCVQPTQMRHLSLRDDGTYTSYTSSVQSALARQPVEVARYLYRVDPLVAQTMDILQAIESGAIVTKADVAALLARFGVRRYTIDADAVHVGLGTIRIKIFQYKVDLKKIREEIDRRKAVGVRYIITKMSVLDYLQPINVFRYIRLKYLRHLRKRHKKVVTKFNFMME